MSVFKFINANNPLVTSSEVSGNKNAKSRFGFAFIFNVENSIDLGKIIDRRLFFVRKQRIYVVL